MDKAVVIIVQDTSKSTNPYDWPLTSLGLLNTLIFILRYIMAIELKKLKLSYRALRSHSRVGHVGVIFHELNVKK